MLKVVTIGVIGDFDPKRPYHVATNEAIHHAAQKLIIEAKVQWLATPSFVSGSGLRKLKECQGVIASPGSPYRSLSGVLAGIRFARETNLPLVGT